MHGERVYGLDVDEETRCVHWHGPTDIVALRMHCCRRWFPCYECHQAVADHCCEVIRLLAATIKKEVDVRRDLGTAAALDEADHLDHDLHRLATTLAACEEMRPTVLALQRSLIKAHRRTWRQNIGQHRPRCGRWRRRQGALP